MSISKKPWTFPGRPYYYILYFQKLIESPTTVKTERRKGHTGPRDNLEGKSCLADCSLSRAAPEGTYWAPRAAPCEEELPCSFLSRPMTLSRTGCIPAAPDIQPTQDTSIISPNSPCLIPCLRYSYKMQKTASLM